MINISKDHGSCHDHHEFRGISDEKLRALPNPPRTPWLTGKTRASLAIPCRDLHWGCLAGNLESLMARVKVQACPASFIYIVYLFKYTYYLNVLYLNNLKHIRTWFKHIPTYLKMFWACHFWNWSLFKCAAVLCWGLSGTATLLCTNSDLQVGFLTKSMVFGTRSC